MTRLSKDMPSLETPQLREKFTRNPIIGCRACDNFIMKVSSKQPAAHQKNLQNVWSNYFWYRENGGLGAEPPGKFGTFLACEKILLFMK